MFSFRKKTSVSDSLLIKIVQRLFRKKGIGISISLICKIIIYYKYNLFIYYFYIRVYRFIWLEYTILVTLLVPLEIYMTKALSMYDSKVKECYLNPWAHVLSICLTVLFSPYQSNEHYDYQGIILTCLKWCILCLMKCILIQVIWLCWKVDFNIGLYICSCINVIFSHVPILSSNIPGQAQEEE